MAENIRYFSSHVAFFPFCSLISTNSTASVFTPRQFASFGKISLTLAHQTCKDKSTVIAQQFLLVLAPRMMIAAAE